MKHFKLGTSVMICWMFAAPLAAAEPLAKIFPDLGTAILESGLDMTRPIHFDPVDYRDGVATYRINVHGEKKMVHALVMRSINPMRPDPPSTDEGANQPLYTAATPDVTSAFTPIPQKAVSDPRSGRCSIRLYEHVNFQNQLLTTNLDFNAYDKDSHGHNINDEFTGVKVGCHAILIYPHQNFGGGGLFFPAFAEIPNFSVYGFNDKATSHFIMCY